MHREIFYICYWPDNELDIEKAVKEKDLSTVDRSIAKYDFSVWSKAWNKFWADFSQREFNE